VPLDAAVAHLKNFGVWIGEIPRRTQLYILAGIAALLLVSLTIALVASHNPGSISGMADAGPVADITVSEAETDAFVTSAEEPDTTAIQIPVPPPPPVDAATPAVAETTEAAPTEEAGYAAEVSLPETPEVLPETNLGGPPDGYEELIAKARSARNWRTAVARLEEATRLWPEGPDAWETLGDILVTQRGQTERARAAYTRCLGLLPTDALSRRARLEGKIRGLR
jgi:tetratricopeptide (TPR) repeat protein